MTSINSNCFTQTSNNTGFLSLVDPAEEKKRNDHINKIISENNSLINHTSVAKTEAAATISPKYEYLSPEDKGLKLPTSNKNLRRLLVLSHHPDPSTRKWEVRKYLCLNKEKQGDLTIGEGTYKKGKLAVLLGSSNRPFASLSMKCDTEEDEEMVIRELKPLKTLQGVHPSIPHLETYFKYTKEKVQPDKTITFKNKMRLLIEYGDQGTLLNAISSGKLNDNDRISITRQMLTLFDILSKKGCTHRDLKESNFVLRKATQKEKKEHGGNFTLLLIDFGSLCHQNDPKPIKLEHNTTHYYVSPEYATARSAIKNSSEMQWAEKTHQRLQSTYVWMQGQEQLLKKQEKLKASIDFAQAELQTIEKEMITLNKKYDGQSIDVPMTPKDTARCQQLFQKKEMYTKRLCKEKKELFSKEKIKQMEDMLARTNNSYDIMSEQLGKEQKILYEGTNDPNRPLKQLQDNFIQASNEKLDVWSIGIIMHNLFSTTGGIDSLPWVYDQATKTHIHGDDEHEVFPRLIKATSSTEWTQRLNSFSQPISSLLNMALNPVPQQRATFNQLLATFNEAFPLQTGG